MTDLPDLPGVAVGTGVATVFGGLVVNWLLRQVTRGKADRTGDRAETKIIEQLQKYNSELIQQRDRAEVSERAAIHEAQRAEADMRIAEKVLTSNEARIASLEGKAEEREIYIQLLEAQISDKQPPG